MPASKLKKSKPPKRLPYAKLDYQVRVAPKGVKSSKDIEPCDGIIGQDRALDAIRTGLSVDGAGYNIFVVGQSGTGRSSAVRHILKDFPQMPNDLHDVCYVNNFKNPDYPRMLMFKAGEGKRFEKDMGYLISSMRKAVPKIFMSEDYKDRQSRITREFENRQKKLINEFEEKLTKAGFVMVQVQAGMSVRNEIQPLLEEEPVSLEKLERSAKAGEFSLSRLDELRRRWDSLRREFDTVTVESKKLNSKLEDALSKLDYAMIAPLVADKVNLLKKRYPAQKVLEYLDQVEEALVSDLDRFREAQPRRGEEEAPPYRKREPFEEFSVNVILDNSEATEVPMVVEKSPSYKNIFGSLERVVDRFGYWRTDFTRIFAGSLLRASGGYLVINALDLLQEAGVYHHLKRSLRNGEIEITGYDPFYMMAGSGIKPEPIPIDVKVILIGEPRIYRILWQVDDEFRKIFKIKAEFDSVMDATEGNVIKYYEFARFIIDKDHQLTYDLSGLQALAEYAKRLSGRRDKLTTRFSDIADIIQEAAFCAHQRKARKVSRQDVYCAVNLKRSRVNLIEDKIQEMFDNDVLMVDTTGVEVGQINGLSVYNLGEYMFGRPTRITVATSLGKAGVVNIEREADLSGPTHNKGVLILSGYLRRLFAQDKPLVMSASITFEQSYSGVDGDSASSTEVYAILSSLSGIPIRQSVAVTGSVNQLGEIQPIGGVNEKIEGFFDVCRARRLTGSQGVIIPHQNVSDLLLRPDVMQAIKDRKFHIYPVKTIEEGIEILTGVVAGKRTAAGGFTPGSVLAAVDAKLHDMAIALNEFGRGNNDKTNEGPSKKKPPKQIETDRAIKRSRGRRKSRS